MAIDLNDLSDGTDIAEHGTINVMCYLLERHQGKASPLREEATELYAALAKWMVACQKKHPKFTCKQGLERTHG